MRLVVAGLVLLACAACSSAGTLDARWSGGADTGGSRLAARGTWCGATGPLLVFSAAGDTGVALALYPRDSLVAGSYSVFDPTHGVTRPGGTVAARWVRRLAATDLRGEQGKVSLTQVGTSVSGTFDVHAGPVGGPARVKLSGAFSSVPVHRGGPDCAGQPGVD